VHRDIKPSNLLINHSGLVKVADFGLAKQMSEDASITQEGTVIGTPLYMSPEQSQGEVVDHRSDIYSLGAAFYHILSGKPPFVANTPLGIMVKHVTQKLPSLHGLRTDLPEGVVAIIERMMAKDPDARFQTYRALIDALEAARPRSTTSAGFWVRAIAVSVDWALISLLSILIGEVAWIGYIMYFIGCWWGKGQTLGM